MTRIFTDGAEMNDILFFDYTTHTPFVTSTFVFASPYYYYFGPNDTAYKSFSGISELYFRERIYTSDFTQTTNRFPSFRNDTTTLVYLHTDSMNHLCTSSSALLEDSNVLIEQNKWYLIEVYLKIANAPNGRCIVYLEGTKVIDYTGNTQQASITTINNIYWVSYDSSNYGLDDLALNDTAGDFDNSWCGDRVVVKITPSGSGTVNNWLNSGSVSGSANYLYVDDFPHDSDSSYTYFSGSMTGTQDKYKMSTFSGTNKLITRIYPEVRARKSVADLTTMKIGYLPSGGTDQLSGSITLTTSYSRYEGTSASANPVSGSAWTEADINAIEFIAEI